MSCNLLSQAERDFVVDQIAAEQAEFPLLASCHKLSIAKLNTRPHLPSS